MKWIYGKIRVRAVNTQLPLNMEMPPATPAAPLSMPKLPPTQHTENNVFEDLDPPEIQNMGRTPPASVHPIGVGIRSAQWHRDQTGTAYGVAKPDTNSAIKESLIHKISDHISPGIVPPTTIRNYRPAVIPRDFSDFDADEDDDYATDPQLLNNLTPHSLQKRVQGEPLSYLGDQYTLKRTHPDMARIAMFDYLTGNDDRHGNNAIYDDDEDRIHAIDNGGAFKYDDNTPIYDNEDHDRIKNNLYAHQGNIPEDFRQHILDAKEEELKKLFDRASSHPYTEEHSGPYHIHNGFLKGNFEEGSPEEAWRSFQPRLQVLKKYMNDPEVQTVRDLYNRLYPMSSGYVEPEEENSYNHSADAGIPSEDPFSSQHSSQHSS